MEDDVLDAKSYSKAFLSPQQIKGQQAYDTAWSELIEKKRGLYFHVHPALTQHDVADQHRYFCLESELARASEIIEERTIQTLKQQQMILAKWNEGATGVQKLWRGVMARKMFLHRFNSRSKEHLEKHFARKFRLERIRKHIAARSIQRRFRYYLEVSRRWAWAVNVVERSVSLHIFRSRRLNARNRMARWQARIFYRYQLMLGVRRLSRVAREAKKRALASEAAEYFIESQNFRRELRELAEFHQHTETFVLHRRVKARKLELYQRKRRMMMKKKVKRTGVLFRSTNRVHIDSAPQFST